MKKVLSLVFVLIISASFARAQTTEVTIQLNEQFFEVLLDAIFKNSSPPEFPIAGKRDEEKGKKGEGEIFSFANAAFDDKQPRTTAGGQLTSAVCSETIRLQREIDGVKTSVRLRDGKIFAPLAFTGSYNPPLIGCVDFSGVAQTNIELSFDQRRQALVGRATVLSVNLSGAGGIGSNLIANLVQSSIDKKINPIEIIRLDKVSFVVPIQNSAALKMKAVGIKNEIQNGFLNVRIQYEFQKAE
ncbi:MAG: hypothetical protein ABWZ66_10265 [Pyrinomonadaceae bacterium]